MAMPKHVYEYDVVVVGGGLAGVCAAIAAARHGARTALIQDRPVLGGNSSSEIRMHVCGADYSGNRPNTRETGILEELRLENVARNPQRCAEMWDLILWEACQAEPQLDLFLNCQIVEVTSTAGQPLASGQTGQPGKITRLGGVQVSTEKRLEFVGRYVIDCTGDGRVGYLAGAEYRTGREAKSEYGEPWAPEQADEWKLGSSLLFTARDFGKPMPFERPPWAHLFRTDADLPHRPHGATEYGYWWIEWGGHLDTTADNEQIRDELLKYLFGVWDHIKNQGDHGAENYALTWFGWVPGKRESRRLIGDYVLRQQDCVEARRFEDTVAYGGWPIDIHAYGGIENSAPPARFDHLEDIYTIPFRMLYSRNIDNLLMAGRDASATHLAHGSTRVMATCAVMGQAAGTAAAMCAEKNCSPRELGKNYLTELQLRLNRDDCYLPGIQIADPDDLAQKASLTASSQASPDLGPQNLVNGIDRPVGEAQNAWEANADQEGRSWVQFEWAEPLEIAEVRLTFDTCLAKVLTLTHDPGFHEHTIQATPEECVADYMIAGIRGGAPAWSAREGELWETLAQAHNNHQRHRIHRFKPIRTNKLRIAIRRTRGNRPARMYGVKVYGKHVRN
ncbi:MAG: FAD-dependent oxidoreductase [Candidatus Zipacnadales bacterium]